MWFVILSVGMLLAQHALTQDGMDAAPPEVYDYR